MDLTVSGEDDPTWEKIDVQAMSLLLVGEWKAPLIRQARLRVDDVHIVESIGYAARYDREHLRFGSALTPPLGPPQPHDRFLGYTRVEDPSAYPDGTTGGTRTLVNLVSILAKARIEIASGVRPLNKSDSFEAYRRVVGDRWSGYIEDVHRWARVRWGYLVPHEKSAVDRLRRLCGLTLDFENDAFQRLAICLHDMTEKGRTANRA